MTSLEKLMQHLSNHKWLTMQEIEQCSHWPHLWFGRVQQCPHCCKECKKLSMKRETNEWRRYFEVTSCGFEESLDEHLNMWGSKADWTKLEVVSVILIPAELSASGRPYYKVVWRGEMYR